MMRMVLAFALLTVPGISFAQSGQVDLDAVEREIGRLEVHYGDIVSDIGCTAPALPAHRLMCESARATPPTLWRVGRLDDLAWAYAYENATKREIDRDDPPRDAAFIARRDACRDEACLFSVLIEHTNASLGGESPYRAP